ncbi:MAG: DEAD/DEAH box helicase [Candidatus Altiarchaeota archaeon]|nr:DEAD/DEAH box helicase [Candidatus Altiarchaeota archaeon]
MLILMKVLERLEPELRKLVENNFAELTSIQKQAMPKILEGKNVLCIAPTGSGKTEAALVPVLNFLLKEKDKKGIIALYIAPLRSLNRDMLRRMQEWCKVLGCRVEVRHGDTSQSERSRQRLKPPQMLITTPETLQAILPAKVMKRHLESVSHVVIDEIHELVSDKRGIQLAIGLERLRNLCGKFQTIGLSATVGTPDIVAKYFKIDEIEIDRGYKSLEIRVEKPKSVVDSIAEISGKKSTLVFTNTRVATELLTKQMRAVKDVGIHHSSLSKEERIETEGKLKNGDIKTLVCTSSMELGIDVGLIDQVIQFNSPRQAARLIQRVGRSGHSRGKTSKGIVLATDFDDILEASVITKFALSGRIEKTEFFEESFDVLGHQIVGLTLDYGDVELEGAYNIMKGAYPYRNLKRKDFDEVIEVLKRLRLISWRDSQIGRKRNSLLYYYTNLSTIPTYNRYTVIDLASGKPVGVLDEEYIIDCYVNSIFILKGDAWRIVDFRGKRVMVIPVSDMSAETPVWVGEDIPVPYAIAQEVGKLRRRISKLLEKKASESQIAKDMELPLDKRGMTSLIRTIKEQRSKGVVPTDDTITLERFIENYNQVIINCCFGTKVNETLSRVLGALLSAKYGETVGVKVDPYRIILTASELKESDVIDVLREIDPDSLAGILEKTITQTNLFRFAFVHVGKRFGVFREDVNFREINLKRVIDSYAGTPVYAETLKEVFQKYFDLEDSKLALETIRGDKIRFVVQNLTTISRFGLEEFKDAIRAEVPEKAIIEAVKNRLLRKKVDLVCLNCGEVFRNRSLDTLKFPITSKCGSWMVAYMGDTADVLSGIVRKRIRGERLDQQETKFLKRAEQSASLVYSYGKMAIIAMNARGVGPRTAERVLEMGLKDNDFFREVLRAEREFIRTSRFWKDRRG